MRAWVSEFEFYKMFLDLGMLLYPNEVFFAFHEKNFKVACDIFGEEPVKQLINEKFTSLLASSTNKNETLLRLAKKAGMDEKIDLDDLYVVIKLLPEGYAQNLNPNLK